MQVGGRRRGPWQPWSHTMQSSLPANQFQPDQRSGAWCRQSAEWLKIIDNPSGVVAQNPNPIVRRMGVRAWVMKVVQQLIRWFTFRWRWPIGCFLVPYSTLFRGVTLCSFAEVSQLAARAEIEYIVTMLIECIERPSVCGSVFAVFPARSRLRWWINATLQTV